MQQHIKNYRSIKWLAPLFFAVILVVACNSSSESKTEETPAEPAATEATTPQNDSLPQTDSTATPRPEDGKTE